MKKKRSPQKGGIRRKYLRLILIVMGVVAVVSVAINLIQVKRLSSIVNNVSEGQKDTVTFFAIDVMDTMVNRKLTNIVESEAWNLGNRLGNFTSDTTSL